MDHKQQQEKYYVKPFLQKKEDWVYKTIQLPGVSMILQRI